MKFTDIYRQLDEARNAHGDVVDLIERAITDLDKASETLRRIATTATPLTDVNGQFSPADKMWFDCEHRLGQQLNAARTALVREIVDYAQTLEAYYRASKRPLTPVH